MAEQQWRLVLGCHRGTLVSRDTTEEKHPSLEACRQAVQKAEEFYKSIGYSVWFAKALGPNGEKEELHPGTPYS